MIKIKLRNKIKTMITHIQEWYGWHFPELQRIFPDNPVNYIRVVNLLGIIIIIIKIEFALLLTEISFLGNRSNINKTNLTDVIHERDAKLVEEAAKVSIGCEISEEDLSHILELCTNVLEMIMYRDDHERL